MKIDGLNTPIVNKKESRVAEKGEKVKAAVNVETNAPSKESTGDVVQLSDRSKLIAKAQELATQAPDVRVDKVNELRNQINAGTYDVSGRTVAEAMLKKGLTTIV